MSEKFPQNEPDDEPQILSFAGLSQAFAKALSRKGQAPDDEPATSDEMDEPDDVESANVEPANVESVADTDDQDRAPQEASLPFQSTEEAEVSDESTESASWTEESDGWDASLHEDDARVTPHSILEAIFFVDNQENQPIQSAQAVALMRGVDLDEVESIVDDLNREYRLNNCPYEIVATGGGFRLVLREAFYPIRDKFYGRVREARLSQAAVDTLALVAYRQPISTDEVNRLRDKPSGHILTQLVRRCLLRVERTESKPRKTIYHTTDRFLELFGLDSPSDLPQIDEMDD